MGYLIVGFDGENYVFPGAIGFSGKNHVFPSKEFKTHDCLLKPGKYVEWD